MDKNQTIGWALIALVFVGFFYWQSTIDPPVQKEQQELSETNKSPDISEENNVSSEKQIQAPKDSNQLAQLEQEYGIFANSVVDEKGYFILENQKLKLWISKKGGYVAQASLKGYTTYEGYINEVEKPLLLFKKDSTHLNIKFQHNNRIFNTKDLQFVKSSQTDSSINVRLQTTKNAFLEFQYKLKNNDFILDFNIIQNGLSSYVTGVDGEIQMDWEQYAPPQEKSLKQERQTASIFYYEAEDGRDYLSETSQSDQETISVPLKWISFKQQFFSTILISPGNEIKKSELELKYKEEDSSYVKFFKAGVDLDLFNNQIAQQEFKWYLGPNDFDQLQTYEGLELQEQLNLGWAIFRWVNQFFLYPLFQLILSSGVGVGITIILLTFAIKLILFPITYKNYLSSAKMRVIKPHLDKINEKNKDADPMKKQQAVMALYKQTGVNPLAGCIPALLQMPILIALYRLFPAAIELRHSSFLWAEDLSSFDSILDLPFSIWIYGDHVSLFTLLMAISMFFYMRFNQQMTPGAGGGSGQGELQEAIQKNMKVMMNFMPFIMLFMFNGFAAGLSFYYFLANVITIVQTLVIKKYIINEEKILEKINSHMSQPMKKSKWQKKLEDIQEKQKR